MTTYWQEKYANWRTSSSPHWRWRKRVAEFLEKKAKEEKRQNEKEAE